MSTTGCDGTEVSYAHAWFNLGVAGGRTVTGKLYDKAAADIDLTRLGLSITVEDILVSRCIWSRVRSFLTHYIYIVATLQLLSTFSCAVFAFYLTEYMPERSTPKLCQY